MNRRRFGLIIKQTLGSICFGFILALPFGIYEDNSDSTSVLLSGHYGGGQYASVIRGCNGPIAATGSNFSDYAFSGHLASPPGKNSAFVIGLKGGKWRSPHIGI
jgi:hypothetical protein